MTVGKIELAQKLNGQSGAGHKDLPAIPMDKAILNMERPYFTIYKPQFTHSLLEHVKFPRNQELSVTQIYNSQPSPPSPWRCG